MFWLKLLFQFLHPLQCVPDSISSLWSHKQNLHQLLWRCRLPFRCHNFRVHRSRLLFRPQTCPQKNLGDRTRIQNPEVFYSSSTAEVEECSRVSLHLPHHHRRVHHHPQDLHLHWHQRRTASSRLLSGYLDPGSFGPYFLQTSRWEIRRLYK